MKLLRVAEGCDGCKQNQSREPATIDGFMPKAQESIMGQQSSVIDVGFWPRVHMAHRFRRISVLKKMMSPHRVKDRCYCAQFICPLDPYMRGRMSDEPSYSPPVDIGGVMVGGTVSRVVESNHPDYQRRLGAGLQWMAGL